MKKLKVGIIGCGAIGTEIAKACRTKLKRSVELAAICDIDDKKSGALKKILKNKVPVTGMDELIRRSGLVIEAASAKISGSILERCVKNRRDIMVMSVGGLLGREDLLKAAEKKGVKVHIPSGAVCGIDGLKSASMGRIDSVTLTTRKPPKGLEGAPYLKKRSMDIGKITSETTVFCGNAEDAIEGFPQNINVSAVLSLAGIGARRTRVRIVTSPDYTRNIHEVEIKGQSGRITTRTENVPSEANPKTSSLAIFSAIATLEGITRNIRIGT